VRYTLPLAPAQLPTLTVVIAIAITGTFVGLRAGLTTAIVGGLISWYLFFSPGTWDVDWNSLIPLFGFSVIAAALLTTSHLFRVSEQRHHQARIAALESQAEASHLFARELAHRLKNALAIIQSIAFQTLGGDSPETEKFVARLRALADANDLLSEDVKRPSAGLSDVVSNALNPFAYGDRLRVECIDARVSSQEVLSLSLALHELGTNAVKYGALSQPGGWVSLRFEEAGDRVRLHWAEHGGPAPGEVTAAGFGTKLLKRLSPDADLAFEPEGLRCSLSFRRE